MRVREIFASLLAAITLAGTAKDAFAKEGVPLRNWSVPPAPSLAAGDGAVFIPVTPCRIADTRDPVGPYGGPILPASTRRAFAIGTHPTCDVSPVASAYSLNFTIVAPAGVPNGSFITVWPYGFQQPLVSTLNFQGGDIIANAAIVPAGGNASIWVISNASIHVIIDVNGYFTNSLPAGLTVRVDASAAGQPALTASNSGNGAFTRGALAVATGTGAVAGVEGQDSTAVPNPSSLSVGVLGRARNGVVGATKTSIGFGVWGTQYDSTGSTIVADGMLGANFGTLYGVYAFTGTIGCNSCTKQFVDPHPTDPSKVIRYVALEGGEAGTFHRGASELRDGEAVIELPDHFRYVTDEEGLTVQLTPVGGPASLWVESQSLARIVVRGTRDVKFHFLVNGIRPAFKGFEPIADGTNFLPRAADEPMPAAWPEWTRRRLVENGTYGEDGHLNRETARRLGWSRYFDDAGTR